MDKRLDGLEAELRRPNPNPIRIGAFMAGFDGYQTPGDRFIADPGALEMFKKSGRVKFEFAESLWPTFSESKTLIDSTALGFATPGILTDQRISQIVSLPRRRLTVRDLMTARPTAQPQVSWIRENVFTDAASPQVESSAKAESAD